MKNLIFILSFLFLLSSCSDDEEADYFELSDTNIEIDSQEYEKDISVKSSSAWSVKDVPDWVTLSEIRGETGKSIKLTVEPNTAYSSRGTKLKFFSEYSTQYLTIKQDGISNADKKESWYPFPFNSFKSAQNISEGNSLAYSFEATECFINEWISDKIYLGNIVSSDSKSNKLITEFKGYHYNPITVGSLIGSKYYSDVIDTPSKESIDRFAEKVIKELPKQNNMFVTSPSTEFYTYRHLYLLGYGNTGEDFCKLTTGKSYQETKMTKGIGLIYTYYQKVFDVIMDLSDNLITENLPEDFINENNLSYVSSINYGRTAFLIIESDYDKTLVKTIVRKLANKEQLTDYEKEVLNKLDVSYLYYTKDGKLAVDNVDKETMIQKYNNSANDNDIIPLNFALNKFNNHSVNTYNYTINIP